MPAKRHVVAAFLLTTSVAAADSHYRPQVDSDGFPLVGNVATKGGSERRAPSPPPDDQVTAELKELRSKLINTRREKIVKSMASFRALCDADGYPLVGNLSTKVTGMQPSEYCTIVRGDD